MSHDEQYKEYEAIVSQLNSSVINLVNKSDIYHGIEKINIHHIDDVVDGFTYQLNALLVEWFEIKTY